MEFDNFKYHVYTDLELYYYYYYYLKRCIPSCYYQPKN